MVERPRPSNIETRNKLWRTVGRASGLSWLHTRVPTGERKRLSVSQACGARRLH